MIRRFIEKHLERASAWEEHVADALDLFDDEDEYTLGDLLFLDEHQIEPS